MRVRDGLPVVSPARALLDIAATRSNRELERALRESVVLELVEHDELVELLRRTTARVPASSAIAGATPSSRRSGSSPSASRSPAER